MTRFGYTLMGHSPYAWSVLGAVSQVTERVELLTYVTCPTRLENGLAASRSIGQVSICWGRDKDAAVKRAHELFRWFGGGWAVNADLPVPAGFEGASSFVRPEDVAESIACGPALDELADSGAASLARTLTIAAG